MATIQYGDAPEQVGDLSIPDGPGPHPVVALWHGGGFAAEYGRDMLAPAAADLTARGFATWNLTYRRLGSGGGWPATFEDAKAGLAHLGVLAAPLDLADITVLGFSAGFPLAVRAATHPGVRRIVDLAGAAALEASARRGGAGSGAWQLLGDPDAEPGAYAGADPMAQEPLGLPALAVHGEADELVPPALSEAWVERVGGELHLVPGAGHFDVHVPGSAGWAAVTAFLEREVRMAPSLQTEGR